MMKRSNEWERHADFRFTIDTFKQSVSEFCIARMLNGCNHSLASFDICTSIFAFRNPLRQNLQKNTISIKKTTTEEKVVCHHVNAKPNKRAQINKSLNSLCHCSCCPPPHHTLVNTHTKKQIRQKAHSKNIPEEWQHRLYICCVPCHDKVFTQTTVIWTSCAYVRVVGVFIGFCDRNI